MFLARVPSRRFERACDRPRDRLDRRSRWGFVMADQQPPHERKPLHASLACAMLGAEQNRQKRRWSPARWLAHGVFECDRCGEFADFRQIPRAPQRDEGILRAG
jgi:hypothetical protein